MKISSFISICCVTYNHKDYISDAIEGFLKQKTSYPFEIIIYDDASTDGTTEIIKSYEKKYPELINTIYQHENQYSKGFLPYPNFTWPLAKGKYIALCEGDDYWTDAEKLQKQIDFLELNSEYIACAHESIIKYHPEMNQPDILCSKAKLPYSQNKKIVTDYTFNEVSRTVLFQSSTLVFRNITKDLPQCIYNNQLWDVGLFLTLGGKGKIHFMNDVMSIYRKHPKSLTVYSDQFKNYINYQYNLKIIFKCIDEYFENIFNTIISKELININMNLWLFHKQSGISTKKNFMCEAFKIYGLWIYKLKILCHSIKALFKHKFLKLYQPYRRAFRQFIKKILICLGFIKAT